MIHYQDSKHASHLGIDPAGVPLCVWASSTRQGWLAGLKPELRGGWADHSLCITALWTIIASDVRRQGAKTQSIQLPSCSCDL